MQRCSLLTHEDLDFTLLEALESCAVACVVAAEEASIFEWMSSVIIKQITFKIKQKQKAP